MKKLTSFCQVLKEMHTKENWFLISASLCKLTTADWNEIRHESI